MCALAKCGTSIEIFNLIYNITVHIIYFNILYFKISNNEEKIAKMKKILCYKLRFCFYCNTFEIVQRAGAGNLSKMKVPIVRAEPVTI